MSDMTYGVPGVLRERAWCAAFCVDFGDELTSRDILVFEVARYAERGEKEMVGEEFHVRHLDVLLQAVQLDAVPVIYVDVFLLCHCEVLVIVKPPDICCSNYCQQFVHTHGHKQA